MKTLLFVVNSPEFFVSHRMVIAREAVKQGYSVHVASANGNAVADIKALGCEHHPVDFARSGQNPLTELKALRQLIRLFRTLTPDLVHLITIKPVLYGGFAARMSRVPAVVAAVSGLGTVFLAESGIARLRRVLVQGLYRLAFSHSRLAVIFQNPDDRDMLLHAGALSRGQVRMIRGSGVELEAYPVRPEPKKGKAVVVMASRLLRDKGVLEFVEAARILNARGVPVVMRLVGDPDPGNPSSVTSEQLESWREEGIIQLPGFSSDIAEEYGKSNIVCLPSYREGLPKALVEAAACGRAVVTTDVPGCRDAIEANKTGLLVPAKDAVALADAIQQLVENPEMRAGFGLEARKLAERVFASDIIVARHMEIYRELLTDSRLG
ncbi:glycosyltransferase family 4 protein [Saccharospirillum sp.]|uniref:glycosyltransferase family 4 protein n=1 Tax=Saccharospirillum sp. TaxID=2033801 RepID=UPI0034A0981A